MCYHLSNTKKAPELEDRFDARFEDVFSYEINYHLNGFDKKPVYIISQQEDHLIEPASWGLLPENAINEAQFKRKFNTLNAKSESLFTSNFWKEPIRQRRCLILADGFFESKHIGKHKYPHYIRLKSKAAFSLAGIYTYHHNGSFSCSIVTKEANPFMAEIHNSKKRMPLILDKSLERDWLNASFSQSSIEELIKEGFTKEQFEAYTVSRDVTNSRVKSDRKDILEPFYYTELNTLF